METIAVHSSPEWIDMVQRVEQLEQMVRDSNSVPTKEGFLISESDLVIGTESLESIPVTEDSVEFVEEDDLETNALVDTTCSIHTEESVVDHVEPVDLVVEHVESIGSVDTVKTDSSWCKVSGSDISSEEESPERT